jgi:hypothetical protein
MNAETVVNVVANCTTAFSALGILIHIFGDPDNPIWDNTVKAWLAKGGLSTAACGAISNVLTLSTPPITEVILNVGISITFFWLNWWQWEIFKTSYLKTKIQSNKPLSPMKTAARTQKRKRPSRKKTAVEDSYYQ